MLTSPPLKPTAARVLAAFCDHTGPVRPFTLAPTTGVPNVRTAVVALTRRGLIEKVGRAGYQATPLGRTHLHTLTQAGAR